MHLPLLILLALLTAPGSPALMNAPDPTPPRGPSASPSQEADRPGAPRSLPPARPADPAPAATAPGAATEEPGEGARSRPHHEHHPSDETDDATTHHSFDDIDKWVARFDDPSREEWQMPGKVVRSLQLHPGMNAADIGAGTGYFNRHLAGAVGTEGKVYACDIEPKMVDYMRERAGKEGTPNVIPVLAAADDPHLPPGELDLILIVDTYHHFDDRLQYFGLLKKALKPGGRVAIIDFVKREIPVGPGMDHKLEREQVISEMKAAGYRLIRQPEFLPYQYFLIFQPE